MSKAKEFVTTGPIGDLDERIYIERPEDTEILEAVRHEHYVTLLGARQMGKTSLLYMLRRKLTTEIPVYVDLAGFSGVKNDDWYNCVAKTIVRRLPQKLRDAIGEVNSCANQYQFYNLLRKIADASSGTDRFVFLLDEVEAVPEEIREHFFGGVIRVIYNDREIEDAFRKYIFVLAGTTPPAKLIPKSLMSPFNISQTIYMSDFSLEGVRKLGENLRLNGFTIDNSVIEYIYDWTHGHPNLTQEIFDRLVQANPGKVTEKMVDDSVDELVAKGCNNLIHILRRVQDEDVNKKVLNILNGKLKKTFDYLDSEVLSLYLIGVIGQEPERECVIRNNIYKKVLRSKAVPVPDIIETLGKNSPRTVRNMQALRRLKMVLKRGQKYPLFIGAGASKTSGVPVGSEIVFYTLKNLYSDKNFGTWEELSSQFEKDAKGKEANFENVLDFSGGKSEMVALLRGFFKENRITASKGYEILGKLVKSGYVDTIFTPNFDHLIADSITQAGIPYSKIEVIHERNKDRLRNQDKIRIIKLHGDLDFADLSCLRITPDDTREIDSGLAKILKETVAAEGMIFIGYAFGDKGITDVLCQIEGINSAIYWVNINPIDKDSDTGFRVAFFLYKTSPKNLENEIVMGFDEFMEELEELIEPA